MSDPTSPPSAELGPSASFQPEAFGRYFLVDRIAAGGMAEIFKAKAFSHGGFENLVVIKRILPHIGDNPEFVEMFQDEAKVSVALQHPNVVRIFDFDCVQSGGTASWFIVMECVDGKDVRNLLRSAARRREPIPVEVCAFVALEVAKGLHYAHTRTGLAGNPFGIVHRDVSPSNVLLSYEGEVKIADFGIAKAESNAYQTRDGVLKGKYEYMSPEQAAGAEIDARSDLFGLGIVLWEMLTGRRLFRTDSETATLNKVREARVDSPDVLRPEIPAALARICLKALARDPDERYASAEELERDLRDFLLPSTPDVLRRRLRDLLKTAFADDIDSERARLQVGEAKARVLRTASMTGPPLRVDWEGRSEPTLSATAPGRGSGVARSSAWLAGLGVAAALTVLAVGAGAVFFRPVAVDPPPVPVVVGPTVLDVTVFPEATVSVDGKVRGSATSLTLEDVAPGDHVVSLEAPGHEPFSTTVTVVAGRITKVAHQLPPIPHDHSVPAPPSEPVVEEGPPVVELRTTPPGAKVVADGRVLCTTPCAWRDGRPGGSLAVQFELAGHHPRKASIRELRAGSQQLAARLEPLPAPGLLTVTVVTGGWAWVVVDGVQLDKTAPFKDLSIAAGDHELWVHNPNTGLDHRQRLVVEPGRPATVRVQPGR